MKSVKILKTAKTAPRVAGNVKPQGTAAKPSSFALACAKQAPTINAAALAESKGREQLRAAMAAVVAVAAKGNMTRIEAGQILAAALGLPNMARTVKGADGKHVAAAGSVVSIVNAWQYAAKDLASRQPAAVKPEADKADADADASEAGKVEPDTRAGVIDTAAKFAGLFAEFQKRAGKSAADEACQMIAARLGYELTMPKKKAA